MALPSTDDRALGLFVKAPIPGTVKTRLATTIGKGAATEFYQAMARDSLACCAEAGVPTTVFFTPESERDTCQALLPEASSELRVVPQCGAHLGERLAAATEHLFREGAGRVLILGTDCPTVLPEDLQHAFDALARHDVVLGPSHDGGYWSIGLNAPRPALFEAIPWSTADVLEHTLRRAHERGWRTALLETRRDIDTAADLLWLREVRDRGALTQAPETSNLLRIYFGSGGSPAAAFRIRDR